MSPEEASKVSACDRGPRVVCCDAQHLEVESVSQQPDRLGLWPCANLRNVLSAELLLPLWLVKMRRSRRQVEVLVLCLLLLLGALAQLSLLREGTWLHLDLAAVQGLLVRDVGITKAIKLALGVFLLVFYTAHIQTF